jgi:membrane peptidoglycan carboxypeptidase
MAIDPKTGDILVMVGSRDYFDDEVDGNFNIGLAKRQPGSSFKPFAYAAALKKGYTTETVVYDSRTQFSTACKKTNLTSEGDCYSPQNYDHKFRGPMTFREALAQSVNVPAVKALYLAGMKNTIELAKDMGISTLDNWQRYGLTLVLGGGEVSLLDITSAYGVFANEGYRYPYTGIKEILSDKQQNIYTKKENGKRVLDVNIARSISDMLSDNTARTPAFGSNSYLYFKDYDVAVKTGTTNDYRDAWIIGYTPNISVGAWAGNNNNSAMKKKVAGFIVAPMWNEFMNFYFKKHPDSPDFTEPEPLDPELKPILIGQKPFGNNIFNKSTTTSTSTISVHSILYWVDKDNPLGEKPLNPSLDPQYDYWEYGVLLWSVTHKNISISDILNNKNNSTNNINKPDVIIKRPKDKKTYDKNDTIRVSFDVSDEENIFRTEYYIDGIPVKNKNGTNGKFSFKPTDYDLKEGEHTLLILVYTKNNTRGGSSVDFRVR